MPSVAAIAPMRAEVGAPAVDRGEVELEVAGVQDDALRRVQRDGVGVRHRVGDRDELDVERADHAPLAVARPGSSSVRPSRPASSMRLRARPSVTRRAVDREAQLAQQVLQRADVVLVAVGGDDSRRCGRRSRAGR